MLRPTKIPRIKSPLPTDRHVGARVRMRRMMLGMSQEKLGERLGLTFQQVQKYEKGANRIGASRLQHLSAILLVPVGFFFEGVPGPSTDSNPALSPSYVADFLATADGLSIAKSFMRIKEPKLRRSIASSWLKKFRARTRSRVSSKLGAGQTKPAVVIHA